MVRLLEGGLRLSPSVVRLLETDAVRHGQGIEEGVSVFGPDAGAGREAVLAHRALGGDEPRGQGQPSASSMGATAGPKFYDASFTHGIYLLEQALKAPFNQILENAGIVPEEIIEQIDAGSDILEFGYDASNFECVNMLEAGIIDPFEVVQTCLKDAVSIASLLLTTEVVMIEENEITLNSLQAPSNPYKIRM